MMSYETPCYWCAFPIDGERQSYKGYHFHVDCWESAEEMIDISIGITLEGYIDEKHERDYATGIYDFEEDDTEFDNTVEELNEEIMDALVRSEEMLFDHQLWCWLNSNQGRFEVAWAEYERANSDNTIAALLP